MTADAYATAFMAMGMEQSKRQQPLFPGYTIFLFMKTNQAFSTPFNRMVLRSSRLNKNAPPYRLMRRAVARNKGALFERNKKSN